MNPTLLRHHKRGKKKAANPRSAKTNGNISNGGAIRVWAIVLATTTQFKARMPTKELIAIWNLVFGFSYLHDKFPFIFVFDSINM